MGVGAELLGVGKTNRSIFTNDAAEHHFLYKKNFPYLLAFQENISPKNKKIPLDDFYLNSNFIFYRMQQKIVFCCRVWG